MSADFTLLGGRLRMLAQEPRPPEDGLWLAASVPVLAPGSRVLDVGCGSGVVSLALLLRQPWLEVVALEQDAALAELARQNARAMGLLGEVHTATVAQLGSAWGDSLGPFEVVVSNPPFYVGGRHTAPKTAARQQSKHMSAADLAAWVRACLYRLAPGGALYMVLHTEALPVLRLVLAEVPAQVQLRPLVTAPQKLPKRVLVRWQPGRHSGWRELPPVAAYEPSLRAQVLEQVGAVGGWL